MFSLIIYILIAAVGFMMGFLYKRATTNAQFFNPDPKKSLRNFLVLFAIAVIVTFGLSWLTQEALGSSNIPDEVSMKFQNTKSVMIFMINLFFFLLIVFSNLYSQSLKKVGSIPYLLTFGFYFVFVMKDAYFISDYYTVWQKSMQLLKGDLPDFHSVAWAKSGLALIVTFFNAVMIWWGFRK
ncbi:MAG: hypothetical protein U0T74_03010 [Chitinophagales bacterium]